VRGGGRKGGASDAPKKRNVEGFVTTHGAGTWHRAAPCEVDTIHTACGETFPRDRAGWAKLIARRGRCPPCEYVLTVAIASSGDGVPKGHDYEHGLAMLKVKRAAFSNFDDLLAKRFRGELAPLAGFEGPLAQILRSPAKLEVLHSLLLLVGYSVAVNELRSRTPRERAHAELYAQRAHLRASDNIVRLPPRPAWLKGHEHEPHGSGDLLEDNYWESARGVR